MGRTFRSDIQYGVIKTRSPNQQFNLNSAYNRLTNGEALFKGKDAVETTVKVSENSTDTVPAWRFLRGESDPGSTTPQGYWEVRKATGVEAIIVTAGELPRYVCTCPDYSKRLAALPLNQSISVKFPKEWSQGLLRDCKHIWAVRYVNDEIKLITLPKDVPIPIEKEKPRVNYKVNSVGGLKSIQTPVKPNNWKGFA